jgi:mRNA interferase MazF
MVVLLRGAACDRIPRRGATREAGGHYPRPCRPAVFNERSGTVIAMAVTSQPQRAGFPLTLELKSVKMSKPAWVKISQVRTLSTRRLGRKLGRVSPEELDRLVEGLNEIIST